MATDASKKKAKASRAKPKTVEKEAVPEQVEATSPVSTKRKATEDVSPVAPKKAKSGKKKSEKKSTSDESTALVATEEPKPKKASKKSKKEPHVDPAAEPEVEDSADDEADGTLALARTLGHTDEDEEETAASSTFKKGQDVGVIPKVSKKAKKKLEGGSDDGPRVIYIGHIPFGFFEHEIRQYLSQFGPITNLRLSRNKRTGASKGYAFVEFEEASTAAIVAKTMDSYLLFGHILKVKLVPLESQHADLFKGANKRFKKVPWAKVEAREIKRPRGVAEWDAKAERETKRRSARADKLKAIGYEFDAPSLKPASGAIAGAAEVEAAPAALDAPPEEPKLLEAPPPTAEEAETTAGAYKDAAPKTKTAKAKKSAKGKKAKVSS